MKRVFPINLWIFKSQSCNIIFPTTNKLWRYSHALYSNIWEPLFLDHFFQKKHGKSCWKITILGHFQILPQILNSMKLNHGSFCNKWIMLCMNKIIQSLGMCPSKSYLPSKLSYYKGLISPNDQFLCFNYFLLWWIWNI